MPVKRELEVSARCSARSTTAFAFGENCLSLVSFAIALKKEILRLLQLAGSRHFDAVDSQLGGEIPQHIGLFHGGLVVERVSHG